MSIECLKCHEEVDKLRLTDHIAAHFDYFPHLCDRCSFSCYNPQEAVEHEVIHNHCVLQNKAKNNYIDNLCMGIYKDCLLASKYGEDYVISNGFAANRKNNVPTGELVPLSQSLSVPASINLVKNVGKSSPVPENVTVDSKEDVVYLSSRKGKVSSSEDGNTDDVLYVPPEKKSDVREKESLPVMKRARKGAQPSASLVENDNYVTNLQLISDYTMCRVCGHKLVTDAGKRSHVGSIHLKLSLACPFCDFVSFGEKKVAAHLRTHGLNPNALEGEVKVAVMKERNIYFKEMKEMFEQCFPPRVVQDEIPTGEQSGKDTSVHVQSTTEASTCLVCNMKVTSKAGKRAHVSDCHLKHTLVCPKASCNFETFKEISMAKHLKGEHKTECSKLDAEEKSKYIQMLAVFVKKLKPVLQMCFPQSVSFASVDLGSKKAVNAQLTSISSAESVVSNVSALQKLTHSLTSSLSSPSSSSSALEKSVETSPNKLLVEKKTVQTHSLTGSSSSPSSSSLALQKSVNTSPNKLLVAKKTLKKPSLASSSSCSSSSSSILEKSVETSSKKLLVANKTLKTPSLTRSSSSSSSALKKSIPCLTSSSSSSSSDGKKKTEPSNLKSKCDRESLNDVPPEEMSDVQEEEGLPVMKRARKGAEPAVSLLDNLQLISGLYGVPSVWTPSGY